jgi:CheY-like chemotaxis protein
VILVVDDLPQNVRLLRAVLEPRGHEVTEAGSGEAALERLAAGDIDLVLLDVLMPGMDGYEVCRRIRAEAATEYLPVVMITASGEQEKRRAIEAGADDFVTKPFDQAELLARVRSLLKVKRYQDEIEAFNRGLRRFLPSEVAELVKGDPSVLAAHRREIAVTFCALHGFAALAEEAEPEDVMGVLDSYHAALGDLIGAAEGTLVRLTADELMVVFNDPLPCDDPAARAVRLAVALRDRVWELAEGWSRLGFELQLAAGVALGHATIGRIGSEHRWEYGPVGRVPTVAERLCESAAGGQILISQRAFAATDGVAITQELGELELRGFSKPARAYDLLGLEG